MFALTRPQRQILATLAMLGFAVAPTAWVAAWVWRVNQPGHVREVEAEISRMLGLGVAIDSVSHPGPGEDILRGVVLRSEDQGGRGGSLAEIARAESVRVVREGDRLALEARGMRLAAGDPNAALAQFEALLRKAGGGPARIDLVARDGLVALGKGKGRLEWALRDLAASFRRDADVAELSASYRVALEDAAPRCELLLARQSGPESSKLTVRLQTAEGPLPAASLAPFFDAEGWLGPAAQVAGTLEFERRGGAGTEWEAEFRGELSDVDLAALVGEHFPGQRLSGLARLSIAEARWGALPSGQGTGWRLARGRIASQRGAIGADLLRAMESEMRFRLPAPVGGGLVDVEYERLGVDFSLTPDGAIRLAGALGPGFAPDAVLTRGDRHAPLARAPEGAANVRGLWKMLVPAPSDVLVPATTESQVFRLLPLPPRGLPAHADIQAN